MTSLQWDNYSAQPARRCFEKLSHHTQVVLTRSDSLLIATYQQQKFKSPIQCNQKLKLPWFLSYQRTSCARWSSWCGTSWLESSISSSFVAMTDTWLTVTIIQANTLQTVLWFETLQSIQGIVDKAETVGLDVKGMIYIVTNVIYIRIFRDFDIIICASQNFGWYFFFVRVLNLGVVINFHENTSV